MRYPVDPPTIEEIIAVMRRAGDGVHGRRLRGLIVVLRRAGLRNGEALALVLAEADLNARRGSLLVRRTLIPPHFRCVIPSHPRPYGQSQVAASGAAARR